MSSFKERIGNQLFHISDRLRVYKLPSIDGVLAVLMYHGLEADPKRLNCNELDITAKACIDEIIFFKRQGYEFISANDLRDIDLLKSGKYLLVSFDDGHQNIFQYLKGWFSEFKFPVLLGICADLIDTKSIYWWEEARARFALMDKNNVLTFELNDKLFSFRSNQISIFEELCRKLNHDILLSVLDQLRRKTSYLSYKKIYESEFVHKNMDWNQIKVLCESEFCAIAAHSMNHEIATNISSAEFETLSIACKNRIETETGKIVLDYIYPNGRCSEQTDQILKKCGYKFSYSTDDRINLLNDSSFRLNRFRGYGLNGNLRYYSYQWKKRHNYSA